MLPFAVGAAGALLPFRFPRSVGLPVLVLSAAVAFIAWVSLKDFSVLKPGGFGVTAQPLSDRELITAFEMRLDKVGPLYRLIPKVSPPSDWWWPLLAESGLAHSVVVGSPPNPLKYGVYRLLTSGTPSWRLEKPELAVPNTSPASPLSTVMVSPSPNPPSSSFFDSGF